MSGDLPVKVLDNRYRLNREIARGGVGIVFESEHVFTGAQIALKVLKPEHEQREDSRRRLMIEARTLAMVKHPNVVEVLDAGYSPEDRPYLAMEMLRGRPLDGILLARGRLEVEEAFAIGSQVCAALAAAHAAGVCHRDVKPGNIFVTRDHRDQETIKLIDFGVARVPSLGGARVSLQGEPLGTPEYMSPEQLMGSDQIDPRADVYALGVTLYECLTGRVPIEGNYAEVLLGQASAPDPAIGALLPDLPADLAAVIDKAMRKDAAERFSDAREFAARLNALSHLFGPEHALLPRGAEAASPSGKTAKPAHAQAQQARRRSPRVPYVTPVLLLTGDTSVEGRAEDVSNGGMLVRTERPVTGPEEVSVRFALPMSGRVTTARAIRRWVKTARGAGAVGLEFVDLSEEGRREIQRYVSLMGAPTASADLERPA